jgi:hypothetical protein
MLQHGSNGAQPRKSFIPKKAVNKPYVVNYDEYDIRSVLNISDYDGYDDDSLGEFLAGM